MYVFVVVWLLAWTCALRAWGCAWRPKAYIRCFQNHSSLLFKISVACISYINIINFIHFHPIPFSRTPPTTIPFLTLVFLRWDHDNWAGLTSQGASETYLCLPPSAFSTEIRGLRPGFADACWESKCRSLCLLGRHFPCRSTSRCLK